jgi:penicillin-binding protein 2
MFGQHEVSPALRRRLGYFAVLASFGFAVVLGRLWILQVLHGEEMAALSENNRIRLRRVQATRGRVTDRFGRVLIDSQASFDAVLVPEDSPDLEETVETLAHFLHQTAGETKAVLDRATGRPPFEEILVKRDLDWEEISAIETHQLELPGVSLRITPSRNYPNGTMLAHVLGYVGEVNQDELGRDPRYRPGDLLGKAGLERRWEEDLRGLNGGQQVEVDSLGRELRILQEAEAIAGNTLVLSVDLDLQRAAEEALAGEVGAVVAIEPRTGEVLAMVSQPSFDPNLFTGGIQPSEWKTLVTDPHHPLTNRATQGQYPPGSTFKFIVAAAALQEGIINPFTHLHCSGKLHFGQRDFRCWRPGGHGSMNVHGSLVQSCDVFFYQVGQRLGVDTIARYARAFGLGELTTIGLDHEKAGTIPDSAWKMRRFGEPWYQGETLSVVIGQGYVTATPLQMAQATAMIATGVRYQPHLVRRIEAPNGTVIRELQPQEVARLDIRDTVLAEVRQGMFDVVNSPSGTGKKAALANVGVAGKTGTSQVVTLGRERLPATQRPWNQRDHAWFVAFAPVEEPTIAVAALVEHAKGGGGAVAAPVAHSVLDAYFRLKSEREPIRYAAKN